MLLEHKVPQLMTPSQESTSVVSTEVSVLKAKQRQQAMTGGQVSNTPVVQVNGNSMNGYHKSNGHL